MSETALALAPDLASAIDAIEDAAGGRQSFLDALALAPVPADDPLAYAIGLIADPRHDARRLSTICQKAGVSIGEVIEAFKRGAYAGMLVRTTATIAAKSPAVVEDVLVRAQPHWVTCTVCKGTLLTYDGADRTKPKIPCDRCVNEDGVPLGRVYTLPDIERQKLALDLANLLPKKGPLVAIQQNHAAALGDASPAGFAKLLAAADDILRRTPPPTVVEAETVVDAPSPTP